MACAGFCPGIRVGTSSAQARSASGRGFFTVVFGGTPSTQARSAPAKAFFTVELEEAPSDDRNGTGPASSADHRRVAGHRHGRGRAQADRTGRSGRGSALRGGVRGRGAGGGAGG